MPISAAIKFTQGSTTDSPGRSVIGVASSAVVATNGNNSGVEYWEWTLLDVPSTSALTPGTLASGAGAPSATFTPDVSGCYRVALLVRAKDNTTAVQIRVFAVPNARTWIIPSFKSGSDELNFGGDTRGWAGLLSDIFADIASGGGSGLVPPAGSIGGSSGTPTVVKVDGASGVLPVLATEIDCTGDSKCQPKSFIGHFATTNNTQATAYVSPHLTAGTWKINIAITADMNNAVDGGSWDISFTMKATGAGTAVIVGTSPSDAAPAGSTAAVAALKATVDILTDTFRVRVTGDAAIRTAFGYYVQIIPSIQ